MTFFEDLTQTKGFEESSARARKVIMFDEEKSLISRYLISVPLVGSHTPFILSAFDNKAAAYKYGISCHKKMYAIQGVRCVWVKVEDVILGMLPIRSVDIKKSTKQ